MRSPDQIYDIFQTSYLIWRKPKIINKSSRRIGIDRQKLIILSEMSKVGCRCWLCYAPLNDDSYVSTIEHGYSESELINLCNRCTTFSPVTNKNDRAGPVIYPDVILFDDIKLFRCS
jgi:hypothetical protein